MKVIRNLYPCAVAALFMCTGAYAQSTPELDSQSSIFGGGLYVSISGVYGEVQDDLLDAVLDPFVGISLSLGKNFENSPLALELQIGYETADWAFGISGDVEILEIMLNARLDFNLQDKLDFYIGGGVGWASLDADASFGAISATASVDGLAAQFRAGLSHPISEHIDLYGGVRYFYFDEIDEEILSLEFGLRYYF